MRASARIRLAAFVACVVGGCVACGSGQQPERRVIVLGFDGLDHELTRDLMARGRMPNFARLAAAGSFAPLGTTVPPQSPVAWSTFITGLDPGGHGVFDFIHRDPKTMEPFLSTTKTAAGGRILKLGKWQFPLSGGTIELLRQGQPFWEVLEDRGIETTIIRMPANFPPSGSATRELSGMGTPDILGGYGTFSLFTSEPFAFGGTRTLSGGTVYPVNVEGGLVRGSLEGPDNPFLVKPEKVRADFVAYIDASRQFVKVVVGNEELLLRVGEWSDFVPVDLALIPSQSLTVEARFYLKQLDPYFQLYVSPLNIDPLTPAMPVSSPDGYAAELAHATGRFYTQGLPEDTKSLKTGVLSADEFLEQARLAGDENRRQYKYVLDRFTGGLLFYYFGNVDQVSHMMWRARDPEHPAYDEAADRLHAQVVEELYAGLDAIVGETAARLGPDDLLVVMSDHGFTSWRRSFHLNSWLRDNGYLVVRDPKAEDPGLFLNVDWSKTRAYGLGLNGLYVNLEGREKDGVVQPGDRDRLVAEISEKLLATVDPASGARAVTKVYRREEVYRMAGFEDIAPDLVVGYAKGTRGSDESALGGLPREVIVDNTDPWNGDHCMDHETVPGILLVSRALKKPAPTLETLASAILAEFGIDGFPRRAETTAR